MEISRIASLFDQVSIGTLVAFVATSSLNSPCSQILSRVPGDPSPVGAKFCLQRSFLDDMKRHTKDPYISARSFFTLSSFKYSS